MNFVQVNHLLLKLQTSTKMSVSLEATECPVKLSSFLFEPELSDVQFSIIDKQKVCGQKGSALK